MTRPKIQYTGSAGNYTALRGGTDCQVARDWNLIDMWIAQASYAGLTFHTTLCPTRELAATAALDWRDEQDRVRIEKEEGR